MRIYIFTFVLEVKDSLHFDNNLLYENKLSRDKINMADSLNPFLEEDEEVETETPKKLEEDNITIGDSSDRDVSSEHDNLNWDAVASKLLKEKLILTALEFHSELSESGRELPRLRDFFSNPANFERTKFASDVSPSGLREFHTLHFTFRRYHPVFSEFH